MSLLHETSITDIYGVGKAKAQAYARAGVQTLFDLVYYFPRAYENRQNVRLLAETDDTVKSAVILTVATEPRIANLKRGMSLLKFRAFDESGTCEITYFNQNYLKDKFPIGSTFRFWGKVERQKSRFSMTSPDAEAWTEEISLPPFRSIYPLSEGLTQKQISQNMESALSLASKFLPDPLPEDIREKYSLCSIHFALRQIHFPESYSSLAIAKRRLIFDEFFMFAAGLASQSGTVRRLTAPACRDGNIDALLSQLPYKLTNAQERVIAEISSDMAKNEPMSRILIGDVGCGKTVCAAAAICIAVKNGYQAALMAPTEILATQHYHDLSPIFERLGIRCALLTGSTTAANKRRIHAAMSAEDRKERLDVVIGTQALLSEGADLINPGLVVTDEQHRFGVNQRALLSEKNKHTHVLVMSATPIPRSLALVMYGDLSMSKIDEMPPGRQRVDTFLVDEGYRERLDAFIKKNVDGGGQVYVVCPAVDEQEIEADEIGLYDIFLDNAKPHDEKPPLKAAVKYAEELSERLEGYSVAFVHGKMKAAQKDNVMRDFTSGKIQILVSTTVIEVGVNVPAACLMIVENAERFGLSQLHQLRGRVGRGQKKSYCILVSGTEKVSSLGQNAKRRLETMCTSYNGFEIAEEDLKIRGPGDFLALSGNASIRQSGSLTFRLADMCEDSELMGDAFAEARRLLDKDPELKSYPNLRNHASLLFESRGDIIS